MKDQEFTPMIRQYMEIKKDYSDSILLFRLGDFYETFFDDAKTMSDTLQLTLTKRAGHPMAGIPYHALDNYLKRLIDNGFKVAICDQMEDPALAKGIVNRSVTRILTPGTVIEDSMLDEGNRFSIIIDKKNNFTFSIFDFTTGEIYLDSMDISDEEMIDFMLSYGIVQILLSSNLKYMLKIIKERRPGIYCEVVEDWIFSGNYDSHLKSVYSVSSLDFLEFSTSELVLLDGVFKYLETTQFKTIKHFRFPKKFRSSDYMFLDSNTIYNLGVVSQPEQRGKSLFDTLNYCKTNMGKRFLAENLKRPLTDSTHIEKRLNAVQMLTSDKKLLTEIQNSLCGIMDLERISSRISIQKSYPKDINALSSSIEKSSELSYIIMQNIGLYEIFGAIPKLMDVYEKIGRYIFEDASNDVGSGMVIKDGISSELDEYRSISRDIDSVLRELEKREKETTGLSSLKIGRNRIYGFYIEISKVQAQSAPLSYTRKQTLTNCERFVTPELNELEKKVLVAQEKIRKIETSIYDEFIVSLSSYLKRIKELSAVISEIDLACSLSQAAIRNSYIRPFFVEKQEEIEIIESRHPMVEKTVDNFQKNDFAISGGKNFIIITGPNMSGKSTYLRQIGLISIMAQIGSFVPAQKAFITIYDRVFTRIGAKDDVVSGKSTFLVEMLEMSGILSNSSQKSLILLDEVGRGTGTLDGIAVAWAISEYLFQVIGAVTLFATHYTELTIMSEIYECVANKRVRILESENGIVFLHKIEEGSSSSSYGIEVAKLAGFPAEITQRALEILEQLSDKADLENRLKRIKNIKRRKYRLDENQLKMF